MINFKINWEKVGFIAGYVQSKLNRMPEEKRTKEVEDSLYKEAEEKYESWKKGSKT